MKLHGDDLFNTPLDQAQIDFENEGGETYICGNPPYLGTRAQTQSQKDDLATVIAKHSNNYAILDFVAAWFVKAAEFGRATTAKSAFVATNSICQGQQAPVLWPIIFSTGHDIAFAYTSFKWSNLASHKAAVTVVIVAIEAPVKSRKMLFVETGEGTLANEVSNINPFLVPAANVFIAPQNAQIVGLQSFDRGSAPTDDGLLFFDQSRHDDALRQCPKLKNVLHRAFGGADFIRGNSRWVARLTEEDLADADVSEFFEPLLERVSRFRLESSKAATRQFGDRPHVFPEDRHFFGKKIFVPQVMSESRDYITCGLLAADDLALAPHFQGAIHWAGTRFLCRPSPSRTPPT